MGQNVNEAPPGSRFTRIEASRKIERFWCSYRDKQMFKLLKYAICAAEHSLTYEVLRKVSPLEADLLRDPAIQARVRFRFGGTEFPPIIMFKIFIHSGGQGVKYICGKKVIKPASEAASDSLRLMGNRKFYDQLIADMCQHEKDRITDEIDVTTMKDYMQYLSHLDECPAETGGKSNMWRRLTLDAIPRQNIVRDIFSFVECGLTTPRLVEECPDLLWLRPATQEIQVASIRAIPMYRRSRQAKARVAKMRKMFGMDSPKLTESRQGVTPTIQVPVEDIFEDDDWEDQADKLYEWTQNLSLDELGVTSP
ncbi:hypothetical protein OS493_018366 [Desmophyllum pertusum]|uniref:Uncharacterized protein n=1 Tax=Desmophyllum pertusum TaxID=174260 RepID=A0A9X0CEA5_9CNID|nr:hypothetical protein OS493_018366 [Desmophyllum pertusum]